MEQKQIISFIESLETWQIEKFMLECMRIRYKYSTDAKKREKEILEKCLKGWASFCAVYDCIIKPQIDVDDTEIQNLDIAE